jgi:hypothetical protein
MFQLQLCDWFLWELPTSMEIVRYCIRDGCGVVLDETNWRDCDRRKGKYVCRDCRKKHDKYRKETLGQTYEYSADNEPEKWEHKKRVAKIRRLRNKLEMIEAYGGECSRCGEDHPLFLVLDHINNNGHLERVGNGDDFIQYLHSLGYPGRGTQLQLLCHNCNAEKEYSRRREGRAKDAGNKTTPELYVAQPYQISKEKKQRLHIRAEKLLEQIETNSIKR